MVADTTGAEGAPAQRIAPLDRTEAGATVQATTTRLVAALTGKEMTLPVEHIPGIMFTLGRFPDVWEPIMALSGVVMGHDAVLPARARELAILRTAWLSRAPYEWGQHVGPARAAGLSADDIEALTRGSDDPHWTEDDRAIVRAVEELRRDATLGDATWDALGRTLDDRQRVELIVLIGHLSMVAGLQNALRLTLEAGNIGLDAR